MTSGLRPDGTCSAKPISQARTGTGRENIISPCYTTMSRNGNHTWSIHTLLSVLTIHIHTVTSIWPLAPFSATKVKKIERRLHFPGEGDVVCSTRVFRAQYDQELSRLIWLSLGTIFEHELLFTTADAVSR